MYDIILNDPKNRTVSPGIIKFNFSKISPNLQYQSICGIILSAYAHACTPHPKQSRLFYPTPISALRTNSLNLIRPLAPTTRLHNPPVVNDNPLTEYACRCVRYARPRARALEASRPSAFIAPPHYTAQQPVAQQQRHPASTSFQPVCKTWCANPAGSSP